MKEYLHVIKTKGYENDSRLLKWLSSLKKLNVKSSVFVLEDKNISGSVKNDDFDIESTSLFFRRIFKKGKGFAFKVPEFSLKCLKHLKRSKAEVIVFHDLQHYCTLLLLCLRKPKNKKIIWDLHELFHESLLKFSFSRKIIEYILSNIDCIIYTNEYRRNYTLKKLNYTEKQYAILNNFTEDRYRDEKKQDLPSKLKDWLGNAEYIIWLGDGVKARNFVSFLKAYNRFKSRFKLVMLGKPDEEAKKYIDMNELSPEYIFATFVKPIEMLSYIDNAGFSVVLYKHSSTNNFFCEPNRLYQLTSRGIPVIVGNNPQMVNLVKKNNAGIVLDDDGSDEKQLSLSMNKMISSLDDYKVQIDKREISEKLSWEHQFSSIFPILDSI